MADVVEIQVACPHCGETYVLTSDLIGQEAECAKCGQVFVVEKMEATQKIPSSGSEEAAPAHELSDAERDTVVLPNKKEGGEDGDTSTVKIPRMSGSGTMVPQVKDQFNLDVVHAQTSTSSKRMSRRSISTPPKKEKKAWWQFWK